MQIQKISFAPPHYTIQNKKNINSKPELQHPQINYLPQAYQDYNINFGAQINRTPANFYEFNKKNLPDTMKIYLEADEEDRQHMPPAQMMKYVYADLGAKEMTSLDFVPRIFPDEPLFADLTDTPSRKARKGLVSQVETLKEEFNDAPLFKDGSSNLGVYLLRKIYIEGKQRKEINKDFYKDLSEEYQGLITEPVDYTTFSAYGIKFPKVPFWNSFVVTRDDWNYEYKPRKVDVSRISSGERREVTLHDILSGNVQAPVKPPKFKIEKKKTDAMADAILKGHGDSNTTEKLLKRRGINNDEELSFVSKYLSQIMSIALENIHASEEMRNFFEKYDILNKKQKNRFEFYWKNNTEMRQLQSLAISDTIKLFFETYGADGNNEEFQELLTYADSIKPARELRDTLHDKQQEEYNQMFADLDEAEKMEEATTSLKSAKKTMEYLQNNENLDKLLEENAIKAGAKVFNFTSPDGKSYRYVLNIDEVFKQYVENDTKILPPAFIKRYFNFMNSSKLATEDYKTAIALGMDAPDFVKEQLMPAEQISTISKQINKVYGKKYPNVISACQQAVLAALLKRYPDDENIPDLLPLGINATINYAEDVLKINKWNEEELKFLDSEFRNYMTPVKNKNDIKEITDMFIDYIVNFAHNTNQTDDDCCDEFMRLLSVNMENNQKLQNKFEKDLKQSGFINNCSANAKLLLDSNLPKQLKDQKCRYMFKTLIDQQIYTLLPYLIMNSRNIISFISEPQIQNSLLIKSFQANQYNI